MNFEVTFVDDVSARLRALHAEGGWVPIQLGLAEARALNRTILTARTHAVRSLAEDVGLPQREVRKSMSLRRATRSELAATLTVTGRRIPLIAFGARQSRAGVSYGLRRGRTVAYGAFIATMRSGHRGVFRRVGASVRRSPGAWSPNLPIVELRGPSLPFVFSRRKIIAALRAAVELAYPKNLEHEMDFLLRGAVPPPTAEPPE